MRPPSGGIKVKGEHWVWLTGMGLAISLTMAGLLLLVIAVEGYAVFWPRRIDLLQIDQGGRLAAVACEQIKERPRIQVLSGGKVLETAEIQLYTGNKDAYGQAYRWVDRAAIRSRERPDDLLVLHRLEHGAAIGRPVALRAGPESLPASDASFPARLQAAIIEADRLRSDIDRIEQGRLGDNAHRREELDRQIRSGHRDRDSAVGELAELDRDYGVLVAEADRLRGALEERSLVLALADGQEREIPLATIIGADWPNRYGWPTRLGVSLKRLAAFLWENPREANTEGGIFPAIFGTLVMTLLMSVLVTPFGVLAAIYLREYARQGLLVRSVRIAVNNLAGVPSIVFGVFGLGFFVYLVGGTIDELFDLRRPTFGTGGILWSSLTLALMTVPVVIVATEEAIAAVPRGMREGSLACGASKWQTIQRIVLPGAVPGILTGLILAMARGAGEVAPLMMVGVVKLAPSLPLDLQFPFLHADQKFMHLGFHIYDLGFQAPDTDASRPMVFATTFFLILMVLALNLTAILIRERLRRRFASAAF